MNKTETAALLLYAAGRDNRKEDRAAVEAWYEDLGDLPFEDCKAAVRQHFQTSTDYLMPAHIRSIVRAIRTERVRAAGDITNRIPASIEAIEDQAEHTAASTAWLQEAKRRIGNGEPLDVVAPRLQIVRDPAGIDKMREIAERMSKDKGAKNEPRETA